MTRSGDEPCCDCAAKAAKWESRYNEQRANLARLVHCVETTCVDGQKRGMTQAPKIHDEILRRYFTLSEQAIEEALAAESDG